MAINQYPERRIRYFCNTETFAVTCNSVTLTHDLDFQFPASYEPQSMQKLRVTWQLVQKWCEASGRFGRTDTTDRITFSANAASNNTGMCEIDDLCS